MADSELYGEITHVSRKRSMYIVFHNVSAFTIGYTLTEIWRGSVI